MTSINFPKACGRDLNTIKKYFVGQCVLLGGLKCIWLCLLWWSKMKFSPVTQSHLICKWITKMNSGVTSITYFTCQDFKFEIPRSTDLTVNYNSSLFYPVFALHHFFMPSFTKTIQLLCNCKGWKNNPKGKCAYFCTWHKIHRNLISFIYKWKCLMTSACRLTKGKNCAKFLEDWETLLGQNICYPKRRKERFM